MGLNKLLPEQFKNFLKKKIRAPLINYQNVSIYKKINEYHNGKFNFYHNQFCLNDLHLNFNTEITRFRNYNNSKFAEYSVMNNFKGSFLSVGISYGTSVKIISHLLDPKVRNIKYFLIDNYNNIGGLNYNTDVNNVKKDLKNIKNFNFKYINEILSKSSIEKVDDDLIFSHLNTGNFDVEYEFLPLILDKTKSNGIIIIDNYGFWSSKEIKIFDEYVFQVKNLFKIVLPSLQCVLIKVDNQYEF